MSQPGIHRTGNLSRSKAHLYLFDDSPRERLRVCEGLGDVVDGSMHQLLAHVSQPDLATAGSLRGVGKKNKVRLTQTAICADQLNPPSPIPEPDSMEKQTSASQGQDNNTHPFPCRTSHHPSVPLASNTSSIILTTSSLCFTRMLFVLNLPSSAHSGRFKMAAEQSVRNCESLPAASIM